MIGIICAMEIELKKLKGIMSDVKAERISSISYFTGKIRGKDCVAAVSGIGKVNSAVCAQTMILKFSPSLIFNIGVAGGLLRDMKEGDVVISKSAVQHDFDTSYLGDRKGLIATINVVNLPCSKKIIDLIENKNIILDGNVFVGVIASGDQFIADKEKLLYIKKEFEAAACDMETGSIAQVCYINSVEFLSVRVISDNVNEKNSELDYEKFKEKSANKACMIIYNLISSIS